MSPCPECAAKDQAIRKLNAENDGLNAALRVSHEQDAAKARALQWYADGNHYWRNAYHEPRITDLGEYAQTALGQEVKPRR